MIVDSSIWIDHLRSSDSRLVGLLSAGRVRAHPCVTGELALGSVARRDEVLGLLDRLPQAVRASGAEVHGLVDAEQLWGAGIGWVDAHLLASARLGADHLWTRDRRLRAAAAALDVAHPPSDGRG